MLSLCNISYLFLSLYITQCLLFNLAASRPHCEDECGFEKAENSLKLALGIIKLVKDSSSNDNKNLSNIIEDDENDKPKEKPQISNDTAICPTIPDESFDKGNSSSILYPSNCADIQILGNNKNGIYTVFSRWQMKPLAAKVYCDLTTEGGGWTVIQRRGNFQSEEVRQSFNQTYAAYAKGFGDFNQEFWLGNEMINRLTTQERMILRIELEDWEGQKRFANYWDFLVDNDESKYKMSYVRYYDSTAGGDSFVNSNGQEFITPDTDKTVNQPASKLNSGFWYQDYEIKYFISNLNGVYYSKGNHLNKVDGIYWTGFKGLMYSLKKVEMKIRPAYYVPSPE